jgi:dihydropyrimidine dehydrogenase (NAD+) subunit PreA
LELDNPIIVSSGYATETESAIARADAFGPGAIVLKTSLPDDEYSKVVRPYAPHRYPSTRAKFDACEDGLMGAEALSTMSLELWAEWLAKNQGKFRTRLIASVAAISVEGHARGAKMMEEAGAKALEILLACPAPYFKPFQYTMTQDARVVREICQAVREAVRIPVGVKIMPFSYLARAAREAGMDWITLGGVFLASPGIDLEALEPKVPSAVFISGSRLYKYVTCRALLSVSKMAQEVHFSAHGGVQDWKDVAEFILYGARSVQAQSIFMLKGFKVIEEMKRGLADYMDRKGFPGIEAMRGAIVPKILTFDEMVSLYPDTKGKIVAQVEESLCNGCGICEEVCAFDAIKVADGLAVVNAELCEGCRLCVADCPTRAIELLNVALMRKQAAGV